MEFVYMTAIIATIVSVFVILLVLVVETENPFWVVVLILYSSALFAFIIINGANEGNKRPCVQYETRLMYNVATKTYMPARVCVEYGEWVDENQHKSPNE